MEVAAGVVVAEQVVSTAIEGGVLAGWALAKPTLPLKASFKRVGIVTAGTGPDSLARARHTADLINGDLYIFGGLVSQEILAGNEMHVMKHLNGTGRGPLYSCIPPLARDGDNVPTPRAGHATCVIDNKIIMFGGYDNVQQKKPLLEFGRVWIFDPSMLQWTYLDAINEKCPQRYDHAAVGHGNSIIIHGGFSPDDSWHTPRTDTWAFSLSTRAWIELPPLPGVAGSGQIHAAAPPNLAVADDQLYLLCGETNLSSYVHILDLAETTPFIWKTIEFPTNPLTPGPRPRKGAGLIPISTGWGRTYLLLMLGAKDELSKRDDADEQSAQLWSGLWALQLPSADNTAAKVKDVTRTKIGLKSREAQWAEVEILPREEIDMTHGKSHPGPRAYFASAALDRNSIVLWGGMNANEEFEADGWVIDFSC